MTNLKTKEEIVNYWIENSETFDEFKFHLRENGLNVEEYVDDWNEYWSQFYPE